MSEVNPLGGGGGEPGAVPCRTVRKQAEHWYGIPLSENGFGKTIEELETYCASVGKTLIVRDWSYVNFAPVEENGYSPPLEFLTLREIPTSVDVVPFAFVRDAIDVWISRDMPEPADFFSNYLSYVKKILELDIPIFKYEEFCTDPANTLKAICAAVGLEFSDITNSYMKFRNVNGDIQIRSRGQARPEIRPLQRRKISRTSVRRLENSEAMVECNKLLGYSPKYSGGLLGIRRLYKVLSKLELNTR